MAYYYQITGLDYPAAFTAPSVHVLNALPLLDDDGNVMPGQETIYAAVETHRWQRRKHAVYLAAVFRVIHR